MPRDWRSSFSSFAYGYLQAIFLALALVVLWLDSMLEPDQSVFAVVQMLAGFSLALTTLWMLSAAVTCKVSEIIAGIKTHPWGHSLGMIACIAMVCVVGAQAPFA
jgi:hypothetical protein